jgi:hypothetical protein
MWLLFIERSSARDRLTAGIFLGCPGDGIALLEHAFCLVTGAESVLRKVRESGAETRRAAPDRGVITAQGSPQLAEMEKLWRPCWTLTISPGRFHDLRTGHRFDEPLITTVR